MRYAVPTGPKDLWVPQSGDAQMSEYSCHEMKVTLFHGSVTADAVPGEHYVPQAVQ